MTNTFNRPTDIVVNQDTFSKTEVGLTNLNTTSFIKLLDNGDLEIIVKDGLGLIFSAEHSTITLMGNAIRFLTTHNNGLVWNRTAFNDQATTYSEASLVNLTDQDLSQIFNGVDHYLPGSG